MDLGDELPYIFSDHLGSTSITADANGNTTRTVTDVWGRPTEVHPPAGPWTRYTYDAADRLVRVEQMSGSNPLSGFATLLSYDYAGRKTAMTDPDMGHWTYAYDALGNLTSQTDARGCTLSMTYDPLNRLTYKSSSGNCGTQVNVTYGYDAGSNGKGHRTSMNDASGSTTWTYDARGRMAGETRTIDGHTFTTQWTYFSNDAVATMTYPDGEVVHYAYHPQGAVSGVWGTDSYAANIRYDAAGRMTQMTRGTQNTTYAFYPWSQQGGRLQSITTGSLQDLEYTYDDVGNITSLDDQIASETLSFEYDALNRLTKFTLGAESESYTYDAAGRLANMASLSYTYGDAAHAHAVTSAGSSRSFVYDANGNMQTRTIGNNT